MQRGWEAEIGGSRPGTEMVGGDYSSQPRPCMGCSAWVDGWKQPRCPLIRKVGGNERPSGRLGKGRKICMHPAGNRTTNCRPSTPHFSHYTD
jgi:hypothetical protein